MGLFLLLALPTLLGFRNLVGCRVLLGRGVFRFSGLPTGVVDAIVNRLDGSLYHRSLLIDHQSPMMRLGAGHSSQALRGIRSNARNAGIGCAATNPRSTGSSNARITADRSSAAAVTPNSTGIAATHSADSADSTNSTVPVSVPVLEGLFQLHDRGIDIVNRSLFMPAVVVVGTFQKSRCLRQNGNRFH